MKTAISSVTMQQMREEYEAGATLTRLVERYGLYMGKVVRLLVSQRVVIRPVGTRPGTVQKPRFRERNHNIMRLREYGLPPRAIGEHFGLSRQRVNQIIAEQNPTLQTS